MDIYENKVVNGVSQCKLKAIASSFISRVLHIINSLGGHAVLLPSSKDLNKELLPDTPLDSSAQNAGNISTENLHNVCYVLTAGMDIYENKVVNGVSQCKLKAIVSSFISRFFNSIHSSG